MKILVINGSPKGDVTVTMQYVAYLRKKFPEHDYQIVNVSQKIVTIERNVSKFQEIVEKVNWAQVILWATPVYVLLVPSQLKRFIELVKQRNAHTSFGGKFAAVLTTSVHYFDHTAHNYLRAICDDWEMKFAGMFSADMDDLLRHEGQNQLTLFMQSINRTVENNLAQARAFFPLPIQEFVYSPTVAEPTVNNQDLRVCIVADRLEPGSHVFKMVQRLRQSFVIEPMVVDLASIDIRGGCLGCCRCAYQGDCVYGEKDGFIGFFKETVQKADILVFAGRIEDRFLSARWKQFLDRGFFRNHTPSFSGRPIGFVIAGPLAQVPNLRQIWEAYTQWQEANLVDFVTDESGLSDQIDASLTSLAHRLVQAARDKYVPPRTFLGVAGGKLFRDEIWGRLRFPFKADYDAFKARKQFDFPQKKDYALRLRNFFLLFFSRNAYLRRQIYVVGMKEKMTEPLRKVVNEATVEPRGAATK